MSTTPTLQDLAWYAQDHFGEDGYPFEESVPSSFDVVVEVYKREADGTAEEIVAAHASDKVQTRLESLPTHRDATYPEIEGFVHLTMSYLQFQYPTAARAGRDQRLLSHLFWGNVVQARIDSASSPEHALAR